MYLRCCDPPSTATNRTDCRRACTCGVDRRSLRESPRQAKEPPRLTALAPQSAPLAARGLSAFSALRKQLGSTRTHGPLNSEGPLTRRGITPAFHTCTHNALPSFMCGVAPDAIFGRFRARVHRMVHPSRFTATLELEGLTHPKRPRISDSRAALSSPSSAAAAPGAMAGTASDTVSLATSARLLAKLLRRLASNWS